MEIDYVERLREFKDYTKDQIKDLSYKFPKLKEDKVRREKTMEKLGMIKTQLKKLEDDLSSGQAGPQNNQNQDQMLIQVKGIMTSFLKSAGKHLKGSEDDLNSVIKIINLDSDAVPFSTNSLIIKLWNTILTSVGEFKKTYQTSQADVSQKLEMMDGKLDRIMDKIDVGQNDMLLELYRISKMQDLILDKSSEKPPIKQQSVTHEMSTQYDCHDLS